MTSSIARSCVLCVRVPASDYEALGVTAARLQESRSRLLRRAVCELIGRPAPLYESEVVVLVEAIHQLKAIRRNLVQLRDAINTGKVAGDLALIESAFDKNVALDTRIAELVRASRFREPRS